MSPDHSEPAPPLQPEDLALASSLGSLRPRAASPDFLDHLLHQLDPAFSDEMAASSPESAPMPLDASLLAFEHELRGLRPLDMDFPTGQRVLHALQAEMSPPAPSFTVLGSAPPPEPARRRWAAATPWAAAAALVAAGWVALPYLPRTGAGQFTAAHSSLIPYAPLSGEKGSVDLVFPTTRTDLSDRVFGVPHTASSFRTPSVSIPEAPAPNGHLNVIAFDLPEEYCQQLGIKNGVGIRELGVGGPAKTHGLEVGDIIIRINGAPVGSAEDLAVMVRNSQPGSVVTLKVLRGRMIGEIPVRLGAAPSA
jgi:hypothetical protein